MAPETPLFQQMNLWNGIVVSELLPICTIKIKYFSRHALVYIIKLIFQSFSRISACLYQLLCNHHLPLR